MGASRVFGLLLIALGAALLLTLTTDVGGEAIVAVLGLGFLVAYASTRAYGFLVPGGILTGLGAGLLAESQGAPNGAVVFGLGLGFVAIAVVDRLGGDTGAGWWWPFIPGGVLVIVGAGDLFGLDDLPRYLVPVALIVIGASLLVRGDGPRRRGRRTETGTRLTVDGGSSASDGPDSANRT